MKLLSVIILLCVVVTPLIAEELELVLDTVVASVDNKPITLEDVSRRLGRARRLSMQELVSNEEAQGALDTMILEELITREAEMRKISVSSEEIEQYIKDVCAKNNLTREEFEKVLAGDHKNMDVYKQEVKFGILRTRLAGAFARNKVSVSDQEIEEYLKTHSATSISGGNKVKLSHILVRVSDKGTAAAQQKMEKIKERLDEDDFETVAQEISEAPDAAQGGDLGEVSPEDLSEEIVKAIDGLDEGEMSEVTTTPAGLHIFKIVEKVNEDKHIDDAAKTEARQTLEQIKTENNMAGYFAGELYKNHVVEKKTAL